MTKLYVTFYLLLSSYMLCAQHSFTIKVNDAEQNALPGIFVNIGKEVPGVTDSTGVFTFEADSAFTDVHISSAGFISANIRATGGTVTHVILLKNNVQLTEAIVYAFNSNGSLKNTAAAITVLNNASFEKYNNISFVQAINTVPGVKMDERSPGSYRLSIRGNLLRSAFGVRNVKLYWQGLPFTDASGNTYLNAISPTLIEKAEIIKGPGGSMYGAGTGGLILLRDEQSLPQKKSGMLQVSGGSYGIFAAAGSYKTNGENISSQISAAHQQADGYRQQSSMRRDNLKYALAAKLRAHRVNATIFLSDLFYETPGGLTFSEMNTDAHSARPRVGMSAGAIEQQAAIHLKLLYSSVSDEIKLSERWTNTTGVYFSATKQDNPAIRNYERKREKGAGGRTVFHYKTASINISGGAEYQYSHVNTATYGNRKGVQDTLQYHDRIDVRQVNVFVQAAAELPANFQLTGGLSYNNFYYGFERINIPGSEDEGNFDPQVIPRVTLLKRIKNIASIYASYSRGYSPPSIDEIHASDGIFNKSLNAERGTNYEAGGKVSFLKNRFSADIAYYIFKLQNTIVSRRDASGADFYVNAGSTDQKGIEGAVNYHSLTATKGFIRKTNAYISITKTRSFFENYKQGTADFSGKRLTGTPYGVFSAGIDAETSIGIYASTSVTYTDKIPLNDANTFYEDDYTLLFARIGLKKIIKKTPADFFVTMQKSFDDVYSPGDDLNAAGNRFYNPSAPLIFSAGVRVDFR